MSNTSIKAKIRALRAKTRASGCTEAEAIAAAELAAKLMREHGLAEDDLVMGEASASEPTMRATWRSTVAAAVGYCTNTASIVLIDRGTRSAEIVFVGRAPGPEIALYLRDVCFRAVEREIRVFKQGEFYRRRRLLVTRRAAIADFIAGFVRRLCLRLMELFEPLHDETARDEAKQALARRYTNAVAHQSKPRKTRYSEAAVSGWRSAANVSLNHAVKTQAPLQIGGHASPPSSGIVAR